MEIERKKRNNEQKYASLEISVRMKLKISIYNSELTFELIQRAVSSIFSFGWKKKKLINSSPLILRTAKKFKSAIKPNAIIFETQNYYTWIIKT